MILPKFGYVPLCRKINYCFEKGDTMFYALLVRKWVQMTFFSLLELLWALKGSVESMVSQLNVFKKKVFI